MQLHAPAKINLSFRIKGRREDGFHEIETLMAPISLVDQLTIEKGEAEGGVEFSCNDLSLPTGEENLVVKAAKLFQGATKSGNGLKIALTKRIPHGAGLGGGSSDAAAVLVGLNKFFEANHTQKVLAQLAAQIGSDVPFFLVGSAALCRGRGEIVEPTSLPMKLDLLLVRPAFGVPTPWAYARWKNSRDLPNVDYSLQRFSNLDFVNDLERPVFEKYVLLAHLKHWLRQQPEVGVALLSGSGSTVFAVLRNGADGQKLAERVREEIDSEAWTCVCMTI
jgi:4-diphosphocytidyl-2-C-methyl-D-erythritol kinase